MPVQVPIDPKFTRVTPEPAQPRRACKDVNGIATVCNKALPEYIDALRSWGRKMAGQLREIADLQPENPKP